MLPSSLTEILSALKIPLVDKKEAVKVIAQKLGENDPEAIRKLQAVVDILGSTKAIALCEKTFEIDKQGGIMTKDGSRKKTLGGIFFFLARQKYKQVRKLWDKPHKTPPLFSSKE